MDSLIVHIKADDIYKHIAEDVDVRFNTSKYLLERPFLKVKNKKVIGLMKDELGKKNHEKICCIKSKNL